MTLTIGKLSTRCRSPRGLDRPGALVDGVARGQLAYELKAQLGPSLDRLPAVIRLKDLRVRVKVDRRKWNAAAFASAWARAFTAALHRALAYPAGDGAVSSRRYASRAAYRAAMLHHIAADGAAPRWEFPELEASRASSPAATALDVLLQEPALMDETLADLDRKGWLEPLLAVWDDVALERLMQAVAGDPQRSPHLSLDHLIEIAQAAAAANGLRREWAFAGRRQAIRLGLRLHPRFPLRGVWHGLRLLQRLLEVPALLILRDPALLADPIPFPSWCHSIVSGAAANGPSKVGIRLAASQLAPGAAANPSSSGASLAALTAALEALRPLMPSAAASAVASSPSSPVRSGSSVKWILSDCAGILLMLPVVQRLNLWALSQTPEFRRFGGERALSFFLAGVGMKLVRPWSFEQPVEPAVALFAGIFDELDLAGMRHFYSRASVGAVAELAPAENWEQALDRAAGEIAHAFAGRVRGFRNASRQAVTKQFVRLRGRILVEQTRLFAVLAPTPWSVALHLSGMDDSLAPGERLGYRRVEFFLEGL